MDIKQLVSAVEKALTDDLRRAPWRGSENPKAGHCYVACEALFHLTGGKLRPFFIKHEGAPHWFLRAPNGDVVDPTAEQFKTPVPYEQGKGKGFLTKQPSRRAQTVIDRVRQMVDASALEVLADQIVGEAGCAILVRDGKVLILKRGPTAPWRPNTWNLPGGVADDGETPLQCAERELTEEAGIKNVHFDSTPISSHEDDGWKISYFVVRDSATPEEPRIDYESSEFRFVGADELGAIEWAIPQIGEAIKLALRSTVTSTAELFEAVADSLSKAFDNLKPDTKLTVYHGTDMDSLIIIVNNGIDARERVHRHYPHFIRKTKEGKPEIVNRGMFVAPDVNTANNFGGQIVEFSVLAQDLYPIFPSPDLMREDDKRWIKKFPNSFRPTLSAYLSGEAWSTEPQALLRGLVPKAAITGVYLRPDFWKDRLTEANIPFTEVNMENRPSVLKLTVADFKKYIEHKKEQDKSKPPNYSGKHVKWVVQPNETSISAEEIIQRLCDEHEIEKENLIEVLKTQLDSERVDSYEMQIYILQHPGGGSESIPYTVARRALPKMLKYLGVERKPAKPREKEIYHGY